MVGFIISMATLNTAGRYVALFLQAQAYAGFIVLYVCISLNISTFAVADQTCSYSWISSSFPRPPAKRAVAIAMVNAFSQLGNIAGSYVWNLSENGYRKSYGIVLAMFGITIVGCFIFRMILVNLNKKLEAGETAWEAKEDVTDKGQKLEHLEQKDEALKMRKGFRYLV